MVIDLSRLGVGAKQSEVFIDGVNADRIARDYRHEQVSVNGIWKSPGRGNTFRVMASMFSFSL